MLFISGRPCLSLSWTLHVKPFFRTYSVAIYYSPPLYIFGGGFLGGYSLGFLSGFLSYVVVVVVVVATVIGWAMTKEESRRRLGHSWCVRA